MTNEHLCIHPVGVKVEKPWGWTMTRHLEHSLALVEIFVNPWGFSSKHKHDRMDNIFLVLSGVLHIDHEFGCHVLEQAESCCIKGGIRHGFDATSKPVSAYEIYRLAEDATDQQKGIDVADIRRFSENGIRK